MAYIWDKLQKNMSSYLLVENVSKAFGEKVLFDGITFGISKDQKVALVAKNGIGKTTLLNIIAGKDSPDTGQIVTRNDITLGYLSQDHEFEPDETVMQVVFNSPNPTLQAIREYEEILESGNHNGLEKAMHKMDALQAWDYENRVKQVLSMLKVDRFHARIRELSGGQKKRLALANVLINEPDLLILDEPTNHLDLEMIEWLEAFLENSKSTLLMVTHDRYFLDRVCNHIIELDDNQLYSYQGNYAYYLEKRTERIENTRTNIDKARSLMRTELEWVRRMPKARTTKSKSRLDSFAKLKEEASRRINDSKVSIEVKSQRLGAKIIELHNVSKSYGELTLFEKFSYKFAKGEKIGVAGANGAGKSTLIKLILGEVEPDAGKIVIGETVEIGYFSQDKMAFEQGKRVIEIIRDVAEVITLHKGRQLGAAQFLEHFLFGRDMHYQAVEKLSGGEKRRLQLMQILMRNPNFLILDEPTNDLDIMTLQVLEEYLQGFEGCLLVVSHDRYFMDKVVDTMFTFEGDGVIAHFPGTYSFYREDQERKMLNKREDNLSNPKIEANKNTKPQRKEEKKKLSYKEKKELEQISKDLTALEQRKNQLHETLGMGNLQGQELVSASQELSLLLGSIDQMETRWLELSEMDE